MPGVVINERGDSSVRVLELHCSFAGRRYRESDWYH